MKKLFYCLAAVALVAGLASCDKKENEATTTEVEFVEGYATFNGTDYSEANNFELVLYTDMTTDSEGYFNSKGSAVQIDLYTNGGETEDGEIKLVAGTYTLSADEDYPAGTFSTNYSTWCEVDDAGEQTGYGIKEGTVVIALSGDVYDIKINLVDSLGNTRIGTYNGAIEIDDGRTDFYANEPTDVESITVNAPADSIMAYDFGVYEGDVTRNLDITIWDANTTVTLSLYIDSAKHELVAGDYTFAEDYSDMTLVPGYAYWGFIPVNSYVATDDVYFYLEDGTLNVTLGKDSVYTISGTLKSHYGSEISVNYTGKIAIEEYSYDDDDDYGISYVAPKNIRKVATNHKKASLCIKK